MDFKDYANSDWFDNDNKDGGGDIDCYAGIRNSAKCKGLVKRFAVREYEACDLASWCWSLRCYGEVVYWFISCFAVDDGKKSLWMYVLELKFDPCMHK